MYKDILTPNDVKNHLRIGKNTVYDLFVNDDSFPSFKIGRKHFILEGQYYEWLSKKGNKHKYVPFVLKEKM